MKKEDILKLAENGDHIPGVYNYCDRWCERCPFTARCLNFKMSEEKFGDPETRDINSSAYWEEFGETFHETLELLKEMAEERGIDLESDSEEGCQGSLGGDDESDTVVHILMHMSRSYLSMVDDWFESYSGFEDTEDEPETDSGAVSSLHFSEEDTAVFKDSVEVVRWYQYQIHVKLRRALCSAEDEKSMALDDCPRDSDGSAKVALIGIDRCIGAWGKILKMFPAQKEKTLAMISLLKRLCIFVEKEFPKARTFVRPGFDEVSRDG
ncbi:MAG: hypothetical protein C4530_05360 [Desulfobacteraceae bacterium]|nr:MAG: hypothetical protein C4530_05360 [Desulfobacteraceae bacterium]